MPLSRRALRAVSSVTVLLAAAVLLLVPFRAAAGETAPLAAIVARDPVTAAWQRAQTSGVYHFATTVIETTHPAPTVANVGSSSTRNRIYLEGDTNLPERSLQMVLYQQGGSLLNRRDGIEVRIEATSAYGRPIDGAWQEIDDFSGAFAPGSDLMAYLAGARNVRQIETVAPSDVDTSAGVSNKEYEASSNSATPDSIQSTSYTRYAFDLNGPELAAYMRDQMEDQLRRQGELPSGVTLDISDQFRDTVGEGEVWIDGDGLPLRLKVHIAYPQQRSGERVETEVITDFSAFDRHVLAAASTPKGWLSRVLSIPTTSAGWETARQQAGFAAGTLCMLAMVVTPLLQSAQVHAFNERTAAEPTAQQARQAEQREAAEAQAAMYESEWNPSASVGEQGTGSKEYAVGSMAPLDASMEAGTEAACSSPSLPVYSHLLAESTPEPDSDDDGDGLTYIQEERLGTDPDETDTDGDQITDDVEVAGFRFEGRTWCSDPLNADTNNDGITDSVECPDLARENEETLSPSGATCQDTDADGTPDIFDRDNDDDAVPDRVDLSPFSSMDDQGSAFDEDSPLLLQWEMAP